MLYNETLLKDLRRMLRKNSPAVEMLLWFELRDRRLRGLKFRRQYSVGRYVVDFYCAKPRLAIELDGDSHFTDGASDYDAARQTYIESCGITVLRFTNQEISKNIDGVLERIVEVVAALRPAAVSTSP